MGVCCKEKEDKDELTLHDDNKCLPRLIEDNEHKFNQMLKRIQITNPFMNVVG